MQITVVRTRGRLHRTGQLPLFDGDDLTRLQRNDQVRALGRLVHRGRDGDLAALGHTGVRVQLDLGGVLVVHHVRAGGAGRIQTVITTASGRADFEHMMLSALYVGIIDTRMDFHRARGLPYLDDDGLARLERNDQVRPTGCPIYCRSHNDLAAFYYLELRAQREFALIQRWQGGACLPTSTVFIHPGSRTRVSQCQRRSSLQHSVQAHKGTATTTTTLHGGSRWIQLFQRILSSIDASNQILQLWRHRSRHGCVCCGHIIEKVRIQRNVLVLAQSHRGLTIHLQLHRAARCRHHLCIYGNPHAFTQRCEVAIGIADPCGPNQFGDENSRACHDFSVLSDKCPCV